MAVDKNEARINSVLPFVTDAQIGDSTNAAFLRSLGVASFDVCIVTIGGDFQSSLETTSLLKGPTRSSAPKSRWRSGRPSATPPTTFSIT